MASLNIVDIFSGIGGLSLGWLNALAPGEAQLLAAVDSDSTLVKGFQNNFPDTRFLQHEFGDPLVSDDSQKVIESLGLMSGQVDVLLAGPPCQTFSSAGKRKLRWDARLAFQVVSIADHLKPKLVLIENVPEFNKAEDGRLLGRVRVALSDAGFTTNFRVFNAANFGVPQSRTRSFILGIRSDLNVNPDVIYSGIAFTNEFKKIIDQPKLKQFRLIEGLQPTVTVGEAIDDLPSIDAGEGSEITKLTSPIGSEFQSLLRNQDATVYNHIASRHSDEMVRAMRLLKPGETPQSILDHPLRRKDYFRNAYARLDPELPSPTITTQTHNPGSGRFTHYRDDRAITVREAARLQSFPDWMRFYGTQESQRRHVGNAVPPLLAQSIASALIKLL